ncbi:MAG: helix-turn-helix domain-containing protein [Planctomycetes bacterium]|nr:helix-turn-helix domain-containing protein [Planctomycetota bacterium]
MDNDPERGRRFMEICDRLFPGVSRAELAEKLGGVSSGTIRNWEIGRGLSRGILARLESLGVSLEYLLHGTGQPLTAPRDDAEPATPPPALSPAEALAANMRHLRKERFPGWGGQRRFAEFLGISANDLCIYEYGRALPNEQRLEDMAARLGLEPDSLVRLLPGVAPVRSSPPTSAVAVMDSRVDDAGQRELETLRREIAVLQAKNEVLQAQVAAQEERIHELREANFALRSAFYLENTPEGAERRRRLLEKLEASLTVKPGLF